MPDNPRDRLAAAVKALEDVTPGPFTDDDIRNRFGAWSAEVIIAARALLVAPDEAAELRAVKAELAAVLAPKLERKAARRLLRRYGKVTTVNEKTPDQVVEIHDRNGVRHSAPTAVALCAKLGIEVSRE